MTRALWLAALSVLALGAPASAQQAQQPTPLPAETNTNPCAAPAASELRIITPPLDHV